MCPQTSQDAMSPMTTDITTDTATAAALAKLGVSPTELLFSDLPQELAATRRVLERVPEGRADWRPHEKSTPLGSLAAHLAQLPRLATAVLTTDELDWAKTPFQQPTLSTAAEIVALFDKEAAAMQEALAAADWPALGKRWVMRIGDQVIVDEQKGKLIRALGISHMAHHRAQLGVYLRLLGASVPRVYGPSADER
jgi:uncharacterized damage-inducible protein DinB